MYYHEKNIPTQQNQASQDSRLSRQNGDQRRTQSTECTQSQRSRQINGVNGSSLVANPVFGFPPRLRLTKPAEYQKVFANPVKSSDRYFTLLAIRNEFNHPRLGLAIAKKNIKKAVNRNVIKRTVRENFRIQQQSLGGMDVVVLARREAVDAPLELLRKSLDKHWLRLVSRCASCS